ncbi:hypothetical protein [Paenibacillus humicus]|uniref:hypothetical protein n=1 Tax=Paenibacillus humicus TaxID=412861 RepID=UPI000FDCD84A|nr:hypothetical protein [Paenibacillus humicus]
MDIGKRKEELASTWKELRGQRSRLPLAPDGAGGSGELERLLDRAEAELLEPEAAETGGEERLRLLALVSGLHLWNGSLDRSHELAQNLDTTEGSYLHGMMHRMEGDYGNANYWFRVAGGHPDAQRLQAEAIKLADGGGIADEALVRKLKRGAEWNAALLTDLSAASSLTGHASPKTQLLEQLQALELSALLDRLAGIGSRLA